VRGGGRGEGRGKGEGKNLTDGHRFISVEKTKKEEKKFDFRTFVPPATATKLEEAGDDCAKGDKKTQYREANFKQIQKRTVMLRK